MGWSKLGGGTSRKSTVQIAAESETAGVCGNAQQAIICRLALIELSHPRHWQFHHLQLCTFQFTSKRNQKLGICGGTGYVIVLIFNNFLWSTGTRVRINNDADYFNKHHSPTHHRLQHPRYVLKNFHVAKLQLPPQLLTVAILKRLPLRRHNTPLLWGCVDILSVTNRYIQSSGLTSSGLSPIRLIQITSSPLNSTYRSNLLYLPSSWHQSSWNNQLSD